MASDRQQFSRAANRYHELLDDDALRSEGDGHAILVPYTDVTHQPGDINRPPEDAYEFFEAEGRALKIRIAEQGGKPDLRLRASVDEIWDTLRDRSIGSITICGLGNFSSVLVAQPGDKQLDSLPSGRTDGWVRWDDLTFMAEHLKRGIITQRVCGLLNTFVNAPLAWGILDDHRNIRAAPGKLLYPTSLEHRDNKKIKPITKEKYLGYEAINTLFPRSDKESDHRREHGLPIDLLPDRIYKPSTLLYKTIRDKISIRKPHNDDDS